MNSGLIGKRIIALVTGAVFAVVIAHGQVIWNNQGEDNLWTNPANWDGAAVPGSGQEARVNLSGVDRAVVDAAAPVFGHFRVGVGGGSIGEVEVLADGFLNADNTSQDRVGVGGGTGIVNQSGGTVRLGGAQVQVGLDNGSIGTYNLSGGTFIGAREQGGTTLFIGQSGGTGSFNVSGGELRTRAGVALGINGGTGLFNVQGSGADQIAIGGEGNLAGRWIQNAGSTLQFGIDAGGVSVIDILDDNGAGGDVTFEEGALLNVGFVDQPVFGTWTVMQWAGTLTDNGLAFAPGVDENVWSFDFSGNELQLTAVPEPATYALIFGIAGAVLLFLRRRRTGR